MAGAAGLRIIWTDPPPPEHHGFHGVRGERSVHVILKVAASSARLLTCTAREPCHGNQNVAGPPDPAPPNFQTVASPIWWNATTSVYGPKHVFGLPIRFGASARVSSSHSLFLLRSFEQLCGGILMWCGYLRVRNLAAMDSCFFGGVRELSLASRRVARVRLCGCGRVSLDLRFRRPFKGNCFRKGSMLFNVDLWLLPWAGHFP